MGIIYKNGIPYGNQPSVDATLTHQGEPADAKAAGDAVSELRNTLSHKADVIYDTASGDIASFPDGADGLPVKDLTVAIEPVQSGTGDPSPTNVRPISGWTGAKVTRAGKNLFNPETINIGTYSTNNVWSVNNPVNNATVLNMIFKENTQYTFSGISKQGVEGKNLRFTLVYTDDSVTELWATNATTDLPFAVTSTQNKTISRIKISFGNAGGSVDVKNFQIEKGTTASAYEAVSGTTTTISWQSSAGTVYGGTLDVTSGVLTVTNGYVDLGTLTWGYDSTYSRFYAEISNMKYMPVRTAPFVCSRYQTISDGRSLANVPDNSIYNGDYNVYVHDSNYNNASTFKTAMSGVQLVYELVTPQTYQLDPVTVSTLLGQNNVWADCGPSTVEYPADTKLYIQKINTPTDDDMIADAQIASGQYFIVNNNLYLSTTTILAGDPIKPGTNCTATNLAAALNAINS